MGPDSGPVIGLDLDNTLVGYDELLCELAVSEGYLPGPPPALGKRALRDALRARGEGGEDQWRRLQALIYGRHMPRARLMDGAADFLARAARLLPSGLSLVIVSHKTRVANNHSDGADFHQAALDFLTAHGFFGPGTGLTPARVFFEPTREAKVARIRELGCTHFVDDLVETYAEPGFPAGVRRILFDPAGDAPEMPGVLRLGSWAAIGEELLGGPEDEAATGADFAGLAGEALASCRRIYGGRNSRVYRVALASGRVLAGKRYHRHPDDPRDRLGAEWNALSLLFSRGGAALASRIARPVARDEARGLALYTFLDGPQASTTPALAADMDACLDFLGALRELSASLPEAERAAIPLASEACLSLEALAANLAGRLARLIAVPEADCLGAELAAFLTAELEPFLAASLTRARALAGDPARELDPARRTLSPSDFGLHNALRTPDGLAFVDFEYFGRDDPAKTLCDVLLHPAMNLPPELCQRFARGFLARFSPADPDLPRRADAVYPLYGVKWCLILLNEFLRGADARRTFAAAPSCAAPFFDDNADRRAAQLAKARAMLNRVRTPMQHILVDIATQPGGKTPLDERGRKLRLDVADIFQHARRGHVGSTFSLIEILRVLYDDILRIDPKHPGDPKRDRLILSKGHGCLALYAVLADKGFFPEDELCRFCAHDGILGGHPEAGKVPGVEASTGALGHGLSIGVGMALSARMDRRDSRVFVVMGDGELNEGSVWEAAMSAGNRGLDNLVAVIDYNKQQSYDTTFAVQNLEPLGDKWRAFGFSVREADGHDVGALREAFAAAPFEPGRPSCVICHTVKGKGYAPAENNLAWHHKSKFSDEDLAGLRAAFSDTEGK